MESNLSLRDIRSSVCVPPALKQGWVYVSSLALKRYKQSPLLRRWCELRANENKEYVLEFFLDEDDLEPTRRIHLTCARIVVSRSNRLTHAQLARIEGGRVGAAFYIDFPTKSRNKITLLETRNLKLVAGETTLFPLGFIMVSPGNGEEAGLWESALREGCQMSVPREKKRERLQRWINRAWMKLRGDLSIEQFDESFRNDAEKSGLEGIENFFTISPRHAVNDNDDDDEGEEEDEEEEMKSEGMSSSFQSAEGGLVDNITIEDEVKKNGGKKFQSVEEMLMEKNDEIRHAVPISQEEIDSVASYVLTTKNFSSSQTSEWTKCSEGELFDCFKSIDEGSGLVRTRTWAKIPGVAPQCLFHILYNNEARKKWDHHYARFDTIWKDEGSEELDILDAIVQAPFGCANREFMEWRRKKIIPKEKKSGQFVIYLRSWSGTACRPVLKAHVRAEVWLSAYLIQWWKDEKTGLVLGSEIMVLTQIDIKGLIPRYLVNALSASAPKRWVKSVTAAAQKEMDTSSCSMTMQDSELDELYKIF